MTEAVFAAEPSRLLIAAAAGIVLLLLLIIKFKIHPILSLLISALLIGLGAGMPVPTLVSTVEKGAGETLQGIVLLIGLGSLFGGILEVSGGAQRIAETLIHKFGQKKAGGAQCVAQTLVNKFSEKKAGIAFGITGLVVGTTVFFEAGVVILIPLAFGLAKKTKKSTLYYVIPLLAGLATGFAFIPPSAGSVLVANMLNVDLGVMIAVGVPVGILSLIFAGILWSKFIGSRINTGLPLVLVAFLIVALIRASVGAAVVAMTMVCAINGGATAFSHVNDSGFWLVSSLLEIDEKTTLKSWTMMETIIGFTGLICAIVISLFA